MKRVALYARVSTQQNQNPEMQLRELRAHCERQGWSVVAEYVDRISSSKVRPEQQQLLAEANNHKFDAVMVWKFDRFARSAIELCQTLETLQKLDITFASLTEQIDTSTAAGKLVFTILGAVAEMERSMIRERVRAGLRQARAEGKVLGPPRITFTPEDIWAEVDFHKGNLNHAAEALGISYGTVYNLNKQRRKS